MKLKVDISSFLTTTDLAKDQLKSIANETYKVFKQNTPIKNGNARRNTRLSGMVIEADYPYAGRLDEGWSKQAPQGMVEPTIKELEKTIIPNAVEKINRG